MRVSRAHDVQTHGRGKVVPEVNQNIRLGGIQEPRFLNSCMADMSSGPSDVAHNPAPEGMPEPDPGFNNIILTGFMGTGKSTVGRLLAQRLHLKHIDTDNSGTMSFVGLRNFLHGLRSGGAGKPRFRTA